MEKKSKVMCELHEAPVEEEKDNASLYLEAKFSSPSGVIALSFQEHSHV